MERVCPLCSEDLIRHIYHSICWNCERGFSDVDLESISEWRRIGERVKRKKRTGEAYIIDKEEWKELYLVRYIQNSSAWKWRREIRKEIDEYICRSCGIAGAYLHVHHLTYDNVFMEPMEDLLTLCECCHQEIHEKKVAYG